MSFSDLLRQSRSTPIAVVHKFLTNYDPNNDRRAYAFVEGDSDRAFYRTHLQRYVDRSSDIYIYNCEGKKEVYGTFSKVIARFPRCRRVLFLVDKDVDDILGTPWPTDPRVFVTDWYSIENYLVEKNVLLRYLGDYVKIRRVEIPLDAIAVEFERQRELFYRITAPVMAWIIVARRAGCRILLSNLDMAHFCIISNDGTSRRRRKGTLVYLHQVTQVTASSNVWRSVRRTQRELRHLKPKRYIRGKFEGWWFVQFINKTIEQLVNVAKESGGSVSVSVSLNMNNYVQLLASSIPTPPSLESFLEFHLHGSGRTKPHDDVRSHPILERLLHWIGFK